MDCKLSVLKKIITYKNLKKVDGNSSREIKLMSGCAEHFWLDITLLHLIMNNANLLEHLMHAGERRGYGIKFGKF